MIQKINELLSAFEIDSPLIGTADELETFRISYLGSKGQLKELFNELKNVSNENKKEFGQQVNAVRMKLEAFYNDKKEALAPIKKTSVNQDLSRTGEDITQGSHHPLSLVRNEIIEVFNRIGFDVSEGPEIEDDWHNFSALNFPKKPPGKRYARHLFHRKGRAGNGASNTH